MSIEYLNLISFRNLSAQTVASILLFSLNETLHKKKIIEKS